MKPAQIEVSRAGGVARAGELARRGIGRGALAAAQRSGDVIRVRKGWYALATLAPEIIQAARVGGALACVSAARHHDLWVPPGPAGLHVAVPPTAARLRQPSNPRLRLADAPDSVTVHWTTPGTRTVQQLPEAIALSIGCGGPETAFVLLESALNRRRMGRGELAVLNALAPAWFRAWSRHAGSSSESGTESMVKLLLLSLGLPFRQQVRLDTVGRVDFVVGDALVVEVDSKEHHADALRDRRRDAALSALGYRSLRFMYSQVVYERDAVEAAIVGALIRGDLAG